MFKINCHQIVRYFGDACQSPKRERSGLRDRLCGPKEHTRWWQRYRGHLQGLLYRLILNSYLFIANIHKRWPSCLSNRQIVSTKTHFSCLFRQCRQSGHAGPPPHCHGRSRLALTPTHRAPRNTAPAPRETARFGLQDGPYGKPIRHVLQTAAWQGITKCGRHGGAWAACRC